MKGNFASSRVKEKTKNESGIEVGFTYLGGGWIQGLCQKAWDGKGGGRKKKPRRLLVNRVMPCSANMQRRQTKRFS